MIYVKMVLLFIMWIAILIGAYCWVKDLIERNKIKDDIKERNRKQGE